LNDVNFFIVNSQGKYIKIN